MSLTRVLVAGPFTSRPFATGLLALLSESGRFDVVEVGDDSTVDHLLNEGEPATLIMEGSEPSRALELVEATSDLSVIMLDSLGATALVGIPNPGWQALAQLIETVAGSEAETAAGASSASARLRIVRPAEFATTTDASTASEDIAPVIDWLELILGLQLLRREKALGAGAAGWGPSPSDALISLGFGSNASETDLREQLAVADQSLITTEALLPASLSRVRQQFGLSEGDLRILCLLLAPEIDGRFATAIGVLQDDLSARRPGLTLLAELTDSGGGAWGLRRTEALAGSMRDRNLILADASEPTSLAVDIGYRIRPAVVFGLLRVTVEDAAREMTATLVGPRPIGLTSAEARSAESLRQAVASSSSTPVIDVRGDGEGAWFERIVAGAEGQLVCGDLRRLASTQKPEEVVLDWLTLGALEGIGVKIVGFEALDTAALDRVVTVLADPDQALPFVAVWDCPDLGLARIRSVIHLEPPVLSVADKAAHWREAAAEAGIELTEQDAYSLGTGVGLDPSGIDACVALASERPTDAAESSTRHLSRVAKQMTSGSLPAAACRVESVFEWDDLVLPAEVKTALRSISDHVTHAGKVLTSWGFSSRLPYGQGVVALFSGPSGTGKTMTAQIIAGDLGLDLLKVDLSQTVSKYLGETEKNIDGVFRAAERHGAVLLFDEADALFGKRSEVKDAHDRHANVEVAYLLQRMEEFSGVAILTTNFKQNIDQAFLRRLRFVIDFPLPEPSEREAIWRRSFPADAPMADDVDLAFLARRLKLAGGNIQQIAVHAAFAAASDGAEISMGHVVAATRRELAKLGMVNADKSLADRPAAEMVS